MKLEQYIGKLAVMGTIGALGLADMFLVANPIELLSRQSASLRNILHSFRISYIHRMVSPTIKTKNPLLLLETIFTKIQRKAFIIYIYFFIWLSGGILLPLLLSQRNPHLPFFPDALLLGLLFSAIASITLYLFWVYQYFPKYIVTPFTVQVKKNDPQLQSIANLSTLSFIEHLKRISILLNMRQVENLSLRNDSGFAVFVASGQDQELINQIKSLGDIDTQKFKFPFSTFITPLLSRYIETRVQGTVQRQKDNSISLWIEYTEKNGRTVAVDMAILPSEASKGIEKDLIDEVTYALAVKLVLKLGYHAHLASTCESMKYFLDGLEAAYHRSWWLAINCYQKSIHIENSLRNSFGYGYYHLGAVLLLQGDIDQGMEYLLLAEVVGPPLAETQYMIALGLFFKNRFRLHTCRDICTDIESRCKTALYLRPDFPEAHHLLGTMFYQRGRLRERFAENRCINREDSFESIDPDARDFKDDYFEARKHLSTAMAKYDKAIFRFPNDILAKSTIFDEQSRLVQERMAATHRLADSLRSLSFFSEADGYYREVLAVYPRNNRSLIDLAKTYVHAKIWGKADEFERYEVLNHPELKWNKSANFYMGWAQMGGLGEKSDPVLMLIDKVINNYSNFFNLPRQYSLDEKDEMITSIKEGIESLDYAFQQYPNYLIQWKQVDWQVELLGAIKSIEKNIQGIENSCRLDELIKNLRLWLSWRINNIVVFLETSNPDQPAINETENIYNYYFYLLPNIRGENNFLSKEDPIFTINTAMCGLYLEYSKILEKDKLSQRISRFDRSIDCLVISEKTKIHWECVHGLLINNNTAGQPDQSKLIMRWQIDQFAEYSLFLIKLLVEAGSFEEAEYFARTSYETITNNINNLSKNDIIGIKVLRFQISMLLSWLAYILLIKDQNIPYRLRCGLERHQYSKESIIDIEKIITKASEYVSHNPLMLFTRALLYQRKGLFDKAIDELHLLSSIIAPFDPHKYLNRELNLYSSSQHNHEPGITLALDKHTYQLFILERISCRGQIDNVVNIPLIQILLSEIFRQKNEYALASDHLMRAVSNSSYKDMNASSMYRLAYLYNSQERFSEASSTIEETIALRQFLSPIENGSIREFIPLVMDSIIQTNQGNYSNALEIARTMNNFKINDHFWQLRKFLNIYINDWNNLIPHDNSCVYTLQEYLEEVLNRFYSYLGVDNVDQANNDSEIITKLLGVLNEPEMSPLLQIEPANQSEDDGFKYVLASNFLVFLIKEFLFCLYNYCEINNASAFSLSELNFNLEYAGKISNNACNVINQIRDINNFDNDESLRSTNSSYKSLLVNSVFIQDLQTKSAEYSDTQAWVLFNQGDIDKSLNVLTEQAYKYGPDMAIINYHLARVFIAQAESQFQVLSHDKELEKSAYFEKIKKTEHYFSQSKHYLMRAYTYNQSRSLFSRLKEVNHNISIFENKWANIKNPLIRKKK